MQSMIDRINELKKQRDAVILAHNYQIGEVQDIADFVGDSFALSKTAKDVSAKVIVFCGVRFMAETAKILNKDKTVLLPAIDAGCPMADMVTREDVEQLRRQYPDAGVVCYVNSSAEVKAVCDISCTSSNAVNVVKSMPQKRIIFVPDENLGSYIAQKVPEKEIILFSGYCITHKRVTVDDVKKAKESMPGAKLLVHPECTPEVVGEADFVGSTAQIIDFANKSPDDAFLIGTEQGVLHWLNRENPNKKFYLLTPKLICANMKKTTLQNVLDSLENMTYEIKLDDEIANNALKCVERMLSVS